MEVTILRAWRRTCLRLLRSEVTSGSTQPGPDADGEPAKCSGRREHRCTPAAHEFDLVQHTRTFSHTSSNHARSVRSADDRGAFSAFFTRGRDLSVSRARGTVRRVDGCRRDAQALKSAVRRCGLDAGTGRRSGGQIPTDVGEGQTPIHGARRPAVLGRQCGGGATGGPVPPSVITNERAHGRRQCRTQRGVYGVASPSPDGPSPIPRPQTCRRTGNDGVLAALRSPRLGLPTCTLYLQVDTVAVS